MSRLWLRETLLELARRSYVDTSDTAFTSGNLTSQHLDATRLPLGETVLLTASDGKPLTIVGLSIIGDGSVVGR